MDTEVRGSAFPSGSDSPLPDDFINDLDRLAGTRDSRLIEFAREFVGRAARPAVQDRPAHQLAALTLGAFRFLEQARPDRVNVQIIEPADEGWSGAVTVVRVGLADRPFVVDTIREYLAAENLVIHRFIHPVLGVERGADGGVERVGDPTVGEAEALVHCEVGRLSDDRRAAIRAGAIEAQE